MVVELFPGETGIYIKDSFAFYFSLFPTTLVSKAGV